MERYLVTGVDGQLGYDVVKELNKQCKLYIYSTTTEIMDITDKKRVKEVITSYKPNVIIHCAAYTNVDKAEMDKELCYEINVNGTRNIVEAAREVGSKVIYVSTDYVFDGTKDGYWETNDKYNPLNNYGYTKYLGELEALKYTKSFIVRTSWVFGINGNNFVKTMLRLAETNDKLRIINDQYGSPTYTVDLAKTLVEIADTDKYGIYHATNSGITTWYEFASSIFALNRINIQLEPITTSEYKTLATRPYNSRLSNRSLIENGFNVLPDWQDALKRYTDEQEKVKVKK